MTGKRAITFQAVAASLFGFLAGLGVRAAAPTPPDVVEAISVQGQAWGLQAGAAPGQEWWPVMPTPANPVRLEPGAQLRVGSRSRATIRVGKLTFELNPESHLIVLKPAANRFRAFLKRGWFYFFHRDEPGRFDIETPTVVAAIRGTEFVVKVPEKDGRTEVNVVDGEVLLTNGEGTLTRTNGETAVIVKDSAPQPQAKIESVNNLIQWCLYYPAVLDVEELPLDAAKNDALQESLTAYRSGDLLAALRQYPETREPCSEAEKVYRAALLLAVGQVDEAERLLGGMPSVGSNARRLADALRKLIVAVKFTSQERSSRREEAHSSQSGIQNPKSEVDQSLLTSAATNDLVLASEWLAASYYEQARTDQPKALERALQAAQNATRASTNFGFAWARVAELEFSFGRTDRAWAALAKALELSPRNPQARALRGFLLAAQYKMKAAQAAFDQAIEADPGLGNAWLGRGLCRIKKGDVKGGQADLQIAATLEPQRAFLRSYLGKAFGIVGDEPRAEKELQLAHRLDPNDPTAWLYSALLREQENRINEAVRDLEHSQELNDNRRLYRSRFLLDQDRAVRSANLAQVYQDAGMTAVAVREAAKGVEADYANFSSHLFLANSYDSLRDPNQVELRYETPWLNEYLLANVLAPVGAGVLSPTISQQEYSRLFERDGLGLASSTEYLSRGAWTQAAAQYGALGTFAYSMDVFYRSDPGQRPNNDMEMLTLDLKVKQQITAKDSLYAQVITYDAEFGDMAQYYDPADAHFGFRGEETQKPMVLAGYHREWSPQSHTLILGGVLNDTLEVHDTNQAALFLKKNAAGEVVAVPVLGWPTASLDYEGEFSACLLEGQQIWQPGPHTFIAGARYQAGEFDTRSRLGPLPPTLFSDGSGLYADSTRAGGFQSSLLRGSAYGYWNWQMIERVLTLAAGVSYDHLRYPANFRTPPLTDADEEVDQVSPKAGVLLTPFKGNTVRGAFTRSLGGVSFDQSFRLEPTLVGGFNQSYRALIPESVAGSLSGARFETWGLGVDQKLPRGVFLGAQVEWLKSDAEQLVGTRDVIETGQWPPLAFGVSQARQSFDFEERNFLLTFNQLLGDWFAVGARYRLSDAQLRSEFADVPLLGLTDGEATLHQVQLYGLFNHPMGFFGGLEALWNQQSNRGYTPDLPGDDFWQYNLHAGYRLPKRRAEVRLSLLNLTDRDYRLNPLNLTRELPRERTLAASLRFYF
jgi:tetratricopeptide (TPR) repeat protein